MILEEDKFKVFKLTDEHLKAPIYITGLPEDIHTVMFMRSATKEELKIEQKKEVE